MAALLQAAAVLALVITGMAVIVGLVSPSEALKRVGVVLVLLAIVPCFISALIHDFLGPVLAGLVTNLERAAYILLIVAAAGLIGWLVLRGIFRLSDMERRNREE